MSAGAVSPRAALIRELVCQRKVVAVVRLCAPCNPNPQAWNDTAPPGQCSECGRPFDIQGRPIADEGVTCPVHDPIVADCPHSEAEAQSVPLPAASWLDNPTADA